jgi:hypothetical protein
MYLMLFRINTAQVGKNCLKKVNNCDFAGFKKKKKKKKVLWRFDKEYSLVPPVSYFGGRGADHP